MRTFYSIRNGNIKEPKKYPLQGRVILKWKNKWLLKIYKNDDTILKGYIVCPKTIYLFDVYIATSFKDALKKLLNIKEKINDELSI